MESGAEFQTFGLGTAEIRFPGTSPWVRGP